MDNTLNQFYQSSNNNNNNNIMETNNINNINNNNNNNINSINKPKCKKMNPALKALFQYRRRRFDESIKSCSTILKHNFKDKAIWFIKCKSLTGKNWIDDSDIEDEGVAELLLDQNALANAPRPGTSFARPTNTSGKPGASETNAKYQGRRPMTKDGRPLTGFRRPGTGSRPGTGTSNVEQAFRGSRPGTSRPVTSSGRFVRLGTASLKSDPNSTDFIMIDKLDLRKYSKRPALGKALCDYLIYVEHNMKKALELAAHATVNCNYNDWWWKSRLGKCYYQLGLLRDSEKQFKSSLKIQDMISTNLELSKVYLKLDQPNKALEVYSHGSSIHKSDINMNLGIARVHDMLNNIELGITYYENVLKIDASNVEAIASLAMHYFYSDSPEIALRLYRRLLQMGVNNTEIWNNLGLCCFYSSQYDIAIGCFQRAISLSDDSNMSDVWYNIGQVGIVIGDLTLAYESFQISVSVDGTHAESFNCLGVLELKRNNISESKTNFETAIKIAPHFYEPFYNLALLENKLGNYEKSFSLVNKSLKIYPQHNDSKRLKKKLEELFH